VSGSLGGFVLLGAIDIAIIAGLSILIGASAPRWPASWLARDTWVTRPWRWETPRLYRRLGVARWAARLPEFGQIFGGRSKRNIPGRDLASLQRYVLEVRRAIWVHVLSMFTWVPLVAFNPWWLITAGAVIATLVNLPFLIILRGNNARLSRMVSQLQQAERKPQ